MAQINNADCSGGDHCVAVTAIADVLYRLYRRIPHGYTHALSKAGVLFPQVCVQVNV